jgi:hypothetical protein
MCVNAHDCVQINTFPSFICWATWKQWCPEIGVDFHSCACRSGADTLGVISVLVSFYKNVLPRITRHWFPTEISNHAYGVHWSSLSTLFCLQDSLLFLMPSVGPDSLCSSTWSSPKRQYFMFILARDIYIHIYIYIYICIYMYVSVTFRSAQRIFLLDIESCWNYV